MDGVLTALQFMGSLIGVVAIIFLAYWSTKWFSKKYSSIRGGRHIKVVERCMVGQDKVLVLARVKGKVYFLAVSSQNTATVDTWGTEEFPEIEEDESPPDFLSVLKTKLTEQLPFVRPVAGKGEEKQR